MGVLILAAVVALFGYVGLWGLSGGWFEGVDRFAIDADPDALLTRVFVVVTWFGTLEGTIIITTAMFFFLLWKRAFRGAIALLGSALSAAYVNDFIKDWVGRPRPEHLAAQLLPEPPYIDLQRLGRALGRMFTPEGVGQLVVGDHLVRSQEQSGEQHPLLRRAEGERLPILDHFERPENPELHLPPAFGGAYAL